jgi:DHA1 family bicyclomycin/chloramphenicol resistance-like MFS transporter
LRARLIVLLSAIGGFLPLATDGFLPAMRPMMAELGASVAQGQATISVTLAGFAVAQLLIGVVADRFGRRPVLISATGLYALASIGVAVAPSLTTLLACRFLQGLSAAAGPVIMRAVVRDLCTRVEGARILSYVGMGMGAVPLAVPIINAQVAAVLGWRATLVVCAAYLAAVLWMTLAWFRETLATPDPHALSPRAFWRVMQDVLGHRQALGYMLCCTFGYAGLAVWISCAPHLLLGYFRQPAESFGLWWAIPAFTYMVGGYLSARSLGRHSSDRTLRAGSIVLLVAAAALVLMLASRQVPLIPFIAFISLYNVGWGIVQPHAQAGALSFFPHLAGRVSSVLGFLQMLGGAAIGQLFGYLHDGTPRAAVMLIAAAAVAASVARVTLAVRHRPEPGSVDS